MSKNATHGELKAVREYDRGKFDDGIKDEESRGQKWDSTARQDISTVGRQSEYGLVSNTGPLGESFGLDWERDMMGSVGDFICRCPGLRTIKILMSQETLFTISNNHNLSSE